MDKADISFMEGMMAILLGLLVVLPTGKPVVMFLAIPLIGLFFVIKYDF